MKQSDTTQNIDFFRKWKDCLNNTYKWHCNCRFCLALMKVIKHSKFIDIICMFTMGVFPITM